MFDVAGVGASAIDLVYVLPAYPAPEGPLSKLSITAHFVSPGGQIATAMAGCAAFGLRAAFCGVTGDDAHGGLIRDELTRRGIDVSCGTVAGAQSYSVILVAESRSGEVAERGLPRRSGEAAKAGERIVLWHRDPAARIEPLKLDPSLFRLLHVDDVDLDAAVASARKARGAGRLVTTDIDRVTDGTRELIEAATHPIFAEHVPEKLTGERDLVRALRILRDLNRGPLVVTRGEAGAIALDGDTIIESPGFKVETVDTTGAGDVFRAGFIAALLEGRRLTDVLRFANAAAAASCTRRGAIAGIPARGDVDRLLGQA